MSFHPTYLKSFFTQIDQIIHDKEYKSSKESFYLGECIDSSVSLDQLVQIMDLWIVGIEKMILLLKDSKTYNLEKKIERLYTQRGISYNEFFYLTKSTLEEEEYLKYPAFRFTKTYSKELRERRFGHLAFSPDDYKRFIISYNLEPIRYLKKDSKFQISEKQLLSHSYCVGKTRSGKTELVKTIIHGLLEKKSSKTSLLILDPHGEMASEIRRFSWCTNNLDQVVYLDPTIDSEHSPVFNPFYIKHKDESRIAYTTDAILEAFEQLLKDHLVTGNMRRLLRHLISASLHDDSATMMDLLTLLGGISRNRNQKNPVFLPEEEKLMQVGMNVSDPLTRRFFEYGWKEVDARTITAVIERVDSILSHPLVRNFIVGENSFNLEEHLNSGKIVIVNLDFTKLGNIGSETIGRLIMSEAQNISAKRNRLAKAERPKTIIFLDECQRFVNPSIERALSEFAKFGTYLFLAHQYIEQLEDGMLKALLSNTDIKIIGRNSSANMKAIASDLGLNPEELMSIKQYHFYFKHGDKASVLFKSNDRLLEHPDNDNYVSEKEAKRVFDQHMIKKYYRKKKSSNRHNVEKDNATAINHNKSMVKSQFSVDVEPDDF